MINSRLFLRRLMLPVMLLVLFISCNSGKQKKTTTTDSLKVVAPIVQVADSQKKTNVTKAPIINLLDTIGEKKIVIYIKDSAATFNGISKKLGQAYGLKIREVIKKNKLKVNGSPIAWYTTQKPPYFFEAGIPVDKKPGKLPKNFFVKNIGGDSVIVAHFFGPYASMSVGYDAINDWLLSRKKKKAGTPYEVYVGDPVDKNGKALDPYRVQTDIIQPYK